MQTYRSKNHLQVYSTVGYMGHINLLNIFFLHSYNFFRVIFRCPTLWALGNWYDVWYDTIRYDMIWYDTIYDTIYDMYLLTATWLTPGCSSTVHIYIQTIHRTIQLTTLVGRLSGIRTLNDQNKINDELTA
jgi:hypothetical protein